MKSKIIFFLLLTINISAFCQENSILYLDMNWNTTSKDNAYYTREIRKVNDTLIKITETDRSGKVLMVGDYSSLNPLTENGSFMFYTKTCGYDTITGQYRNGEMVGIWIFKNRNRNPKVINYDLILNKCFDSENSNAEEEDIFVIVENMPTFKGGDINTFREYIQKNLNYPPLPAYFKVDGRALIRFVVKENGEICDINIVKSSLDKDIDREFLRVASESPKWKNGTQRGKPVKVRFTIPLYFKL